MFMLLQFDFETGYGRKALAELVDSARTRQCNEVHAVHVPCTGHAMHMPCIWHAHAMHKLCTGCAQAMCRPCTGNAPYNSPCAMHMPQVRTSVLLRAVLGGAWVFGRCGNAMASFDDGVNVRGFGIMNSDEV